jgi:hypothetical protein
LGTLRGTIPAVSSSSGLLEAPPVAVRRRRTARRSVRTLTLVALALGLVMVTPGATPVVPAAGVVGLPAGNWDSSSASGPTLSAWGWAMDPDARTAPVRMHVYVDGRWGGEVLAEADRPDVGAAFPGAGNAHGWSYSQSVAPGEHTVCVYALDVQDISSNTPLGCRKVAVQITTPLGNWEGLTVPWGTSLSMWGWAMDPDSSRVPVTIFVFVDGGWGGSVTAAAERPDVGAAFPGTGNAHGWSYSQPVARGEHSVCLYAIDVENYLRNTPLGCRKIAVGIALPIGYWEGLAVHDDTAEIWGWALDPDNPAAQSWIQVLVDDQVDRSSATADSRRDVAAAFPGAGEWHGFGYPVRMGAGEHSVCVNALDLSDASKRTSLGCRKVAIQTAPPVGSFDALSATSGRLTAWGWVLDPDRPTWVTSVDVYVDGRPGGRIGTNQTRTDVGAAFPGAGNDHGWSYAQWTTPGAHTVCVYAIDIDLPLHNTGLGCRQVTVPAETAAAAIQAAWEGSGAGSGPLGQSAGPVEGGLVGGGSRRLFQNGAIYWSPTAHASVVLSGPIRDEWESRGAEGGELGYPTGDGVCGLRDSGCRHDFEEGALYSSAGTGVNAVSGIFLTYWRGPAQDGWLGYPVADASCGLRDGGCVQEFEYGVYAWSGVPDSQPWMVAGPVLDAWIAEGAEDGLLGYPVGGPWDKWRPWIDQHFQHGRISARAADATDPFDYYVVPE